jgi:hypothetical protein
MLLTYEIDFMHCLQGACALYLHDSVADHQMQFPHSCLPPLTAPSYISYHKGINELTIYFSFDTLELNINCYYLMIK